MLAHKLFTITCIDLPLISASLLQGGAV